MTSVVAVTGATLIDGTGRPGFPGTLLMDRGRIVAAGSGVSVPAGARIVDADGLSLAPGFIDMHAHSDLAVLADPDHLGKVSQGITTEVLGQDGLSYAPVTPASLAVILQQISGWNGTPDGLETGWESVAAYLRAIDEARPAANAAYLIPQGSVRMNVIGTERRRATPVEIEAMQAQIAQGMREGAFGMSSGLSYVPSMFADTDELAALCTTVAAHGGLFAPHQRSYGRGALEGYAEMIEIADRSRCPLHLTHATMNFAENRGRAHELLALIDDAIARGIEVTLDTYPYLPGATTLAALLPSWAAEGGPLATMDRLRDPSTKERIAHELDVAGTDGCHGVAAEWSTIEVSGVRNPALAPFVGRTIAEIASAEGRPAHEVAFDVMLRDELSTTILQHVGHEENVRAIMRHPAHMGGSDGILVGAKPHPRSWGTFPRYLSHYVRDEGVLELEEAVAHFTSRPARRLGLARRGLIKRGYFADLVLFDPQAVRDRATFAAPRTQADGIPWVFVAGETVISEGRRTDARPGRALRKNAPPTD